MIGDLGCARAVNEKELASKVDTGTYRWMAPEVISARIRCKPVPFNQGKNCKFVTSQVLHILLVGKEPRSLYFSLYVCSTFSTS